MERKYLIGGNWKLQLNTLQDVLKSWKEIDQAVPNHVDSFIAVPPPFLYQLSGERLSLAAQNMHYETKGAFTGETSVLSLIDAGVRYVLIGHSERRIVFRETDREIRLKIGLALRHGLTPVLCIGETAAQRDEGDYEEILRAQLRTALGELNTLEGVEIAYEPVWAINSPALNPGREVKAATAADAQETHRMIRDFLKELFGEEQGESQRIIYGGSMKPKNAEELLSQPDIDGGLVGGASLSAENFVPILETAARLTY